MTEAEALARDLYLSPGDIWATINSIEETVTMLYGVRSSLLAYLAVRDAAAS